MTEKTIERPRKSCFWSHDWGKWEQYDINWNHRGTASIASIEKRQKRICQACGKVEDELVAFI